MCIACKEYQAGLITLNEWWDNARELSCPDIEVDEYGNLLGIPINARRPNPKPE